MGIDEVKFIFVTTYSDVDSHQGDNYIESLLNFAKFFKKLNIFKNSMSLCVTKVPLGK